jgi:hypothetical protein
LSQFPEKMPLDPWRLCRNPENRTRVILSDQTV